MADLICEGNTQAREICRQIYRVRGVAGLEEIAASPLRGSDIIKAWTDAGNDDVKFMFNLPAPRPKDSPAARTTKAAGPTLMDECFAIRVSWSWFRTAAKVDKSAKAAMTTAANTTDAAFSASKRLMDARHPTIKEVNSLRNRIQSYVRGNTLPVTKLGDTAGEGAKEGGTFLIKKADMSAFATRMDMFKVELEAAERRLNAEIPSIREMDQARLGGLYRAEDYPAAVQLRMSFHMVNLETPPDLVKFAPAMFERERQAAAAWWEGVYAQAAGEFLEQFQAVVGAWVNALGPVTHLYPLKTGPMSRFHGAEMRRKLTRQTVSALPERVDRYVVRYREGVGHKFAEEELDLSPEQYAELKPQINKDKTWHFQNTTVEALLDMVSKFRRLGGLVQASGSFEAAVSEVEKLVGKLGTTPDEVGEQLRGSSAVRNMIHAAVESLDRTMATEISTFTQSRRRVERPAS